MTMSKSLSELKEEFYEKQKVAGKAQGELNQLQQAISQGISQLVQKGIEVNKTNEELIAIEKQIQNLEAVIKKQKEAAKIAAETPETQLEVAE